MSRRLGLDWEKLTDYDKIPRMDNSGPIVDATAQSTAEEPVTVVSDVFVDHGITFEILPRSAFRPPEVDFLQDTRSDRDPFRKR